MLVSYGCDGSSSDNIIGIGDRIESALSAVGITPESVENWLRKPCGCRERKERLNALEPWARRVLQGKIDLASEYLKRLME